MSLYFTNIQITTIPRVQKETSTSEKTVFKRWEIRWLEKLLVFQVLFYANSFRLPYKLGAIIGPTICSKGRVSTWTAVETNATMVFIVALARAHPHSPGRERSFQSNSLSENITLMMNLSGALTETSVFLSFCVPKGQRKRWLTRDRKLKFCCFCLGIVRTSILKKLCFPYSTL